MGETKTKAIRNIEQKMEEMDASTTRHLVLRTAKNFKTSWIDLGRVLYTVWKDKLYKDWGYDEFDAFTAKEIGIRKETALKLLRSYSFLEKEGPRYLRKDYSKEADARSVPTYEAVDVLRRANKSRKLDGSDYSRIKTSVLEKGKDVREIKKDLAQIIKKHEELEPEDAWQEKRMKLLKRFISLLKSVQQEIKISKILPAQIIKETDKLIDKLEDEISR